MNLFFSVHNIFNVAIINIPRHLQSFLSEEYNFFKIASRSPNTNLEMRFVDHISLPEDSICLKECFYYHKGTAFFQRNEAILKVPLKDISSNLIEVSAESKIDRWFVLHVIEKILHLKVIEQGYCFLHAAGIVNEMGACINSTLQSVGKTQWILTQLKSDTGFLGDDLIMIGPEGEAFAYPRGMNIHCFHGKIYRDYIHKYPKQLKPIQKATISVLGILYSFLKVVPSLKRRIGNSMKARSLLRVSITHLMPETKIVRRARLYRILITFCSPDELTTTEYWTKKRITQFLIRNIGIEQRAFVFQYLKAFYAHGDQYSVHMRKYVSKLFRKEVYLIRRAVQYCDSKVEYSSA